MRFMNRRRGQKGFTLIELLIVVAIIGIIAAILIPNLIDALQKAKQKRTVGDMRNIGTAWFSWLTDQVSAASAGGGGKTYDFSFGVTLSASELLNRLFPSTTFFYVQNVPAKDGWGGTYEYRQGTDLLAAAQVLGIRSFGRDRTEGPETNPYTTGPFIATDYDEDIVWADGFFVHYPAGVKVQ